MIVLKVDMVVKPGAEEKCKEFISIMQQHSRQEPGCLMYVVHQRKDDPQRFLVYEQYKDEAALEAHRNSDHFQEYATNGVYTMIDERDAGLYQPLE